MITFHNETPSYLYRLYHTNLLLFDYFTLLKFEEKYIFTLQRLVKLFIQERPEAFFKTIKNTIENLMILTFAQL